ncbi:unnamed protein product [Tuber melanosporum]|uniref:(Perigord truffle) hypothetical protein n=1 Tax=Tuber melanosporum (strain Mel28) TaxID=656061 RepID=D5G6Y3_TUBMM|nr:uncharacterized protein GSTUM_00002382001 [Tuber melanosporum]CAZ80276.1 unnamed protein product [Tuber melanosporum]
MALCGPSTALGSLQKHVSADKTLQQDRVQRQGSFPNAFRTQNTDPRLEHEFSQFSSSVAAANLEIATAHHHQQQHQHLGNVDASWASDFRRLHVGAGPPLRLPHHQQQQQWGGGWHEEFLSHPTTAAAGIYTTTPEHVHPDPQQLAIFSGTNTSAGFPRYTPISQNPYHSPAATTAPTTITSVEEDLINEAFEKAFESAGAQLAEPIATTPQPTVAPPPQAVVEEPPKQEESNQDKDCDDLSRTAGNLLTSLQNNQSQKFRESNFLALMRRLRDREVKVEGDGLVEISDDRGRRSDGSVGVGVAIGGGESWGDGGGGEGDGVGDREGFLEHSWWDL